MFPHHYGVLPIPRLSMGKWRTREEYIKKNHYRNFKRHQITTYFLLILIEVLSHHGAIIIILILMNTHLFVFLTLIIRTTQPHLIIPMQPLQLHWILIHHLQAIILPIWFIIILRHQQQLVHLRLNPNLLQQPQPYNQHWVYQHRWMSMYRWISILIVFNTVQVMEVIQRERILEIHRMNHSTIQRVHRIIRLRIIHRKSNRIVQHRIYLRIQWQRNKRCFYQQLPRIMIIKIWRNSVISFQHHHHQHQWIQQKNERKWKRMMI